MPFGPYKDFEDCLAKNQDKRDPGAYCGTIKKAIEGGEFAVSEASQGKKLLLNVEIFQTGIHVPAEGEVKNWTAPELEDIVKAFQEGVNSPVYLKIGHTTPEFCAMVASKLGIPPEVVKGEGPAGNGMISLGRAVDVRLRKDGVMVADFEAPEAIADLIEKGYTDVSIELQADYPGHPWTLSAVALLGAERPAVKGLAGLEAVAVLAERKPVLVTRFSATPNGLVQPVGIKPMTLEELEEINAHMEQFIKGKKAANLLRQGWEQIKQKWTELLGLNSEELNQEEDMDKKKITAALRMQDGAPDEEVLTRLNQLMEAVAAIAQALGIGTAQPEGAMPPPGEMAEKVKALVAAAAAHSTEKFNASEYTEKLKASETRIAVLERDKRMASFKELVRPLTAIEGTPDALAEELVTIHDKMGKEAADRTLAGWKQAQKFAEQAGVLARIGSSREGGDKTAIEVQMDEWLKAHPDKTEGDAYVHFRMTSPEAFREFRKSQRDGS